MATEHREKIKELVRLALLRGETSYEDVLFAVGGADPMLVAELKTEIEGSESIVADRIAFQSRAAEARRATALLANALPAADPMRSQWWFTLETAVVLSDKVAALSNCGRAVFLGTPTVSVHYRIAHNSKSVLLDIDGQVAEAVRSREEGDARRYDVADEIPRELIGSFDVAVLDPPWYPDHTEAFLQRGRQLVRQDGYVLCVLPPIVTRPNAEEERATLLRMLIASGDNIVSVTEGAARYYVPGFEQAMFQRLGEFAGRVWRAGDLLIVRKVNDTDLVSTISRDPESFVFTRDPRKLRVFFRPAAACPSLDVEIQSVVEFEENVSTRAFDASEICVWTSAKRAAKVKDHPKLQMILQEWAAGRNSSETVRRLTERGVAELDATRLVDEVETALGIWELSLSAHRRSSIEVLSQRRALTVSEEFASSPSEREHPHRGDGYRLDFQRDRDRVLWSHSLKRLSNKAQVFDFRSDEHVRRRLSHSIEVMQLASTIATAFGLDRDLTEAGSLAHDVGHTPFGHAGEHALNVTLEFVTEGKLGFNHYEHGVDVVRWLEDVYQSAGVGGFPGLNLTPETMECIFKHTYFRSNHQLGQDELWQRSKHQSIIPNTSCHLEGQAVRISDKLSYLMSDLEDGIRMGILTLEDLLECRLFSRPSVDLRPDNGETLLERFISQRRAILQILMEDVLNETDRRLAGHSDLASVRREHAYIVNHSPEIDTEVKELWNRLQAGKLHPHPLVAAANRRAAEIATTLLLLFSVRPGVMSTSFVAGYERLVDSEYMRWYEARVGRELTIPSEFVTRFFLDRTIGVETRRVGDSYRIPTCDLVRAKDYVASLTDSRAVALYKELVDVAG